MSPAPRSSHQTIVVLLAELFSNEGVGTMVHADDYQQIRKARTSDVPALLSMMQQSVDDAALVGNGQRGGYLLKQLKRIAQGQRTASQTLRQVFAVQPLHGQELLSLRRLPVGDVRYYAGVPQLAQKLRLTRKTLRLTRSGAVPVQNLERDKVPAVRVAGAIYSPHTAAACRTVDLEAAGKDLP